MHTYIFKIFKFIFNYLYNKPILNTIKPFNGTFLLTSNVVLLVILFEILLFTYILYIVTGMQFIFHQRNNK